jgi:hypothetical protein
VSDKGRAFVKEHSPYTGTTYFIHYLLGDLENVSHDHRLFTGDKRLAFEARTSVRTVIRAKAQLVTDGFLEVLNDKTSPGHPAEYRFLFPETGDKLSPVQPEERVTPCPERVTNGVSRYISTKENPRAVRAAQPPIPASVAKYKAEFDMVLDLYPPVPRGRNVRKLGQAAFAKTRENGGTGLLRAVRNYAESRQGQDPQFTKAVQVFFGPNEPWREWTGGATTGAVAENGHRPAPVKDRSRGPFTDTYT